MEEREIKDRKIETMKFFSDFHSIFVTSKSSKTFLLQTLQFPIFMAWIYIFITVRKISDKQKIISVLKNDLDRFAVDRHVKLDKILSPVVADFSG